MKTKLKLFTTISIVCLFAGQNFVRAGNFLITADDTVVTNTNTGQTSGNASTGYDNAITSSTSAFLYGGTNTIKHFVNAAIVGSSNSIVTGGGYITGTSAGAFGNNNNITTGNYGTFAYLYTFGADNSIKCGGEYGAVVTTAFALGRNNIIRNTDSGMSGNGTSVARAFAIGDSNSIISNPTPGGGIGNAYIFGGSNSVFGSIAGGLSNFYLFGINNNVSNDGGRFGDGYVVGNNNIIKGSFNSNMSGAYMFGSGNKIFSTGSTSIGAAGNSSVTNGFTIGNSNSIISTGSNGNLASSFAIGSNNSITSSVGNYNVTDTYALGSNNNIVAASRVIVVGMGNTVAASATNTFVIGNSINATNPNNVILGHSSADGIANPVSTVSIGGFAAIAPAGAVPVGVVSIGTVGKERQLTNVAAGRISANSTDAINGSELYITNTTLAALVDTVASLTPGSGTAVDALLWDTSGNAFVALHGGTNNKITGVLAGVVSAGSSDAINGAQLHDAATSIVNILGTGTVNSDGTITSGTFVTGGTTINQAITNLYQTTTAFAADALVWSSTLNAYDASHGTGAAQRITNVANGAVTAASVDAVNGSQLYGTANSIVNILGTGTVNPDGTITGGTFVTGGTTINQAINNLYYNTTTFAADALTWSNTLNAYDASHGTGMAQRITNVANGVISAASRDAINGSQLYGTATSIINILGTGTVNSNGTVTGGQFIINGGTFNNVSNALLNLSQTVNNIITSGSESLVRQDALTGNITIGASTGGGAISIVGASGDRQLTGVAAGIADNDAVNVAQLKASGIISGTGTGSTIANVLVYDSAVKATVTLGGATVTGTGAQQTGGTRITNLALAAISAASTDAVTGSQLFDTNQRVTNLETTVAVLVSSATNTPAVAANPHFSTGGDDTSIPATANGGNAVAAGMGASASGASSSAIGANAKARSAKSVAIGALSDAQAAGSVALGNNAVVVAAATNSVAIGTNSIATEPDTVSFGSDMMQRRLVNIADGINPHDAVNTRQLAALEGAVNGRVDNLQNQVNTISDRLDRVGAMSAAMSQVLAHLVPDGKRNQLALGIGAYRGHGAFAMGYSYINSLGDCGIRASFSLSDRADIMAGTGVIYGW